MTAKPPPLPPRPRGYTQALPTPLGGPPEISAELADKLALINNGTVREWQAIWQHPKGEPWNSRELTGTRIMLAAGLIRAAQYAILEERERQQRVTAATPPAAPLPKDIPYDASIGPWPEEEETTKPMPKRAKPHG